MVDSSLYPAIKDAVRRNELGPASPTRLCFARKASSGASFGVFQGDTHSNPLARQTLRDILAASGCAPERAARIMTLLSQPCPDGNPLTGDDTALVNAALESPVGQALVDAMDQTLMTTVLRELDTCIAAAAQHGRTIAPASLLYIACWVNMTGPPTSLRHWLGAAPQTHVTTAGMIAYLRATRYFTENPGNFRHLQQSVQGAEALLPA